MLFPRHFNTPTPSLTDFILQKQLGKGTYGSVAKYIHKITQQPFAIKRISFKDRGPRDILMIQKQLSILYRIRSEYIVQLIDHFEIVQNSQVYLIMEYIEGGDLHKTVFNKKIKLTEKQVASITYQLALGLVELHENGIIHRDIKLQNVIYLPNGKVKLVDLGCSNFYGQQFQRMTNIGTKIYFSPQLVTGDTQDDRLDVWCLAVVLYELMFGVSPFRGVDMEDKIKRLQYQIPKEKLYDIQLKDLFTKMLCYKHQRIRAKDVLNHPWILKNFQKSSLENDVQKLVIDKENLNRYKLFLLEQIANCEGDIEKLKDQNQILRKKIQLQVNENNHNDDEPDCF